MPSRKRNLTRLIGSIAATLLVASMATAQGVTISSDVAAELDGIAFLDEELISEEGMAMPLLLGALPDGVEIDAYATWEDDHYFSITASALIGGLAVGPADIVKWDGTTYTLFFDADTRGVPDGANIDALTLLESGGTLFPIISFDAALSVTNILGTATAQDQQLVLWTTSAFSVISVYDVSSMIEESLDVDAFSDADGGNGILWYSFDASGTVGGVHFDDNDILARDVGAGTWSILYDGSAEHAGLEAADVIAVPEAGVWSSLVVGGAFLALIGSRRQIKEVIR